MWQHHAIVLAVLAALALPVYVIDHILLRSRGDIFLIDLSGMLITFYAVWLALHVVVSSAALHLIDTQRLYTLHGLAAVVSVGLLVLGHAALAHIDGARGKAAYEARMLKRHGLLDVITLENWWYVPDAEKPEAIGAVVLVEHSGRFAARVRGRTAHPESSGGFYGEMRPQKQVTAGERIEHEFSLTHYSDDGDHGGDREEAAREISFTFMLFRDRSGSAPENVIKTYVAAPERADDGERFYAVLPPPLAPPPAGRGAQNRR